MAYCKEKALAAKQRYFEKKKSEAKFIDCKCGCGQQLLEVDDYARPREYVSGHNGRKYYGEDATNWAREKRWRIKNPETIRKAKQRFYRRRKVKALRYLGSVCKNCALAYNGLNAAVFDFHHIDPEFKESNLNILINTVSWEALCIELDKCLIYCSNCHRLHHHEGW